MELTPLAYFYNVARAGSFTRGARLSHVSPPAVSKAIKGLEAELGKPLFVRTTRRVHLTEAGEVLFAHAAELLGRVEAITTTIAGLEDDLGGTIRIGANEVFSLQLLPDALGDLADAHPRVVPRVHEMLPQEMEQLIAAGRLDLGLTVGGGGRRDIDYRTIASTPGRIVCGAEHALAGRRRIRARDLEEHGFVVPSFFDREDLPAIDQFPDEVTPRRVAATIELLQMAIAMVRGGRFLGYFPETAVARLVATGELRVLTGVPVGPPFELRALTRRGAPQKAAVERLVERLAARLSAIGAARPSRGSGRRGGG